MRTYTFQQIIARTDADERIYRFRLTPVERRMVDEHNALVRECRGDIKKILKLGRHPFAALREKYSQPEEVTADAPPPKSRARRRR